MSKQQERTLGVYDSKAADYAAMERSEKHDEALVAFCEGLAKGGRVLDLGCGPGRSAGVMADWGFVVDATDGSAEMVKIASKHPGVTSWQALFEDLDADALYDGVWANFSLLHAPRDAFPGHLARIARALKPGGLFHIGMKLGSGAGPDSLGRYYAYYAEDELRDHLESAGFVIEDLRKGEGKSLAGVMEPHIVIRARKDA